MIKIIITLIIVAALLLCLLVSKVKKQPIQKTSRTRKNNAEGEGDLTMNLPGNTKEESGTMATWFHKSKGKNGRKADITAYSSDKLTNASIPAKQEIEGISKEINDCTDGLENNADNLELAAASIQELAGGAIMETEEFEEVKSSNTVQDATENETETLKEMVNVMENAQQSYDDYTFGTMESLYESSDQTSKFVEEISKIAEQASLSALNAVIEAFGSEDTLNSFALIAKEFSYLSQNNIAPTEDITERIEQVEDKADTTDSIIKPEPELVHVEKDSVADSSYQNIIDSIDEMVNTIINMCESTKIQTVVDEISQAMEEVSSSAKTVTSSTEVITPLSEDVTSLNEEVSSQTDNASSATREVSSTAENASSATKEISSTAENAPSATKEVSSQTEKVPSSTKKVTASTQKVTTSAPEKSASSKKKSAPDQEISVTAQERAVSSQPIDSNITKPISTFEDINISIMDLSKTHESKKSKKPVIVRKNIFKK